MKSGRLAEVNHRLAPKAQIRIRSAGITVGPLDRSRQRSRASPKAWSEYLRQENVDKTVWAQAHAVPRVLHPNLEDAAEFVLLRVVQRGEESARSSPGLPPPRDNGVVWEPGLAAEQQWRVTIYAPPE